jgi:hypothetical protein
MLPDEHATLGRPACSIILLLKHVQVQRTSVLVVGSVLVIAKTWQRSYSNLGVYVGLMEIFICWWRYLCMLVEISELVDSVPETIWQASQAHISCSSSR